MRYLLLLLGPLLSGCAALTKGGITATAAGIGAGFGAVTGGLPGAVAGGALAGGITGSALAVGDQCVAAPDTIWTVAEKAVELGGIGLIVLLAVPAVLAWLLPGPLERKRK